MTEAGGRNRWLAVFFRIAPIFFLVFIFQDGLRCWFIADDFAWLGLLRHMFSFRDVMQALFEPAAQGTIRPWSERGFFLLFEYLFGIDNLPFRIMAFATMAANLLLINRITRWITHSALAGFIAAMCWAANTALVVVMTWSSAYNEAQCALFLLSALALFIRYTETGKRKYWWWQLVVFSLGFGALEINVVYPALAAAYALFVAPPEKRRRLTVGLWPFFAISVAYFFVHRALVPLPTTGPYVIRIDWRVFKALAMFGKWSLLPVNWTAFGHSAALGKWILLIGVAGIGALLVSEIRRRRTTVWFFVVWYLAPLSPVLVLPDQHIDYYLTIPLIGLGMMAGFGATCASRENGRWRWAALLPIAAYLCGMVPISRSATHWSFEKTIPVRGLVLGAQAAHEKHPGKTILLNGVTKDLYEDSVGQGALWALGVDNVYLTLESSAAVRAGRDMADVDAVVLDPDVTVHAIKKDQLVIYSVAGDHLRNITEVYELSAPNRSSDRLPSRVDAGNALYSWLLGPTWLPPESGVRWMPAHATVRLRGPESEGEKLELNGFFPAEQLQRAPRVLKVSVDGVPAGEFEIRNPESGFHRLFNLSPSIVGKESVEIELEASPVDVVGGQEYGMVFGKIAIRY